MAHAVEGDVLWEPTAAFRSRTELARYLAWLKAQRGLRFDGYHAL